MLVGRCGLSPVMVGRAAELLRLTRLLEGSSPSVALVGGEAGVGKTRLVQELLQHLPAGVPALVGQADQSSYGRPLDLLIDAVSGVPDLDADALATVEDRQRPSEERLLAGLELIRRITRRSPALVAFEDLHWADSESIALFERLAEPDSGRLLLVGTYRPDALSRRHPASDLLPRLDRRHSVTHLHLGRLSASEVGDFLEAVYDRTPSYRVVEALHTRTGGNPFFLEELVAAAGDTELDQLCNLPLPWTVAEVIRAQVDDLDADERRVVEAAAVLGRKVSFDLLATVTRCTEDQLIAILRRLVELGLMVETEADVFSFRHALAREAIESGLLGRERRRLHEAALGALREVGSSDCAALARHAHGAGRYDDMVVAAKQGAKRFLELGSTFQALQLAELGLSEAEEDLELRSLATRSAWLAGMVDDAIDHCDAWLSQARRAGDVASVAAALRARTRLAWEASDTETLHRTTEQLIGMLDDLPGDEERGWTMAAVAQSSMLRERHDDACRWADQVVEIADRLDLPALRLAGLVEKGSALADTDDREAEGVDLLMRVAKEGERLGEHVIVARALNNMVWHAKATFDPAQARVWVERMRQSAERAGFDSLAGAGYAVSLATLSALEGDLDGAIEHQAAGRRRDRGTIGGNKVSWYMITQAGFALEAGNLDAAELHLREVQPPTEKTRVGVLGLEVHLAAKRGDLAAVRQLLPALLAAVDAHRYGYPATVHDIVSAVLRAGLAADEVRPLVERAGERAGQRLAPGHAWRRLLEAQLAEADGDPATAVPGYEAAARDLPANLDTLPAVRATAHVGAARCLIALGDLAAARRHVVAAQPLLARWRGWRLDELRSVERRLGLGEEVAGPAVLTPREREVVALLTEGLTNSELAERLFISPKTAAVHVSNILAKLGMASRAEVAAWAVSEGLATQRMN